MNQGIIKKKNISKFNSCFGCGVCAASCGRKIIKIQLNKDGFYTPYIEEQDKCTECGICLDVCAYNHKEPDNKSNTYKTKSWAAWNNNEGIRRRSSSGGISYEIGSYLIQNDYLAVGCKYNISKQRAEHFIATSIEDYAPSIGSKYIQSYTEEAFKQIKFRGKKYLITGTPCQIASFRRMIRKFNCEENYILMDFFCHSVPSILAWKQYLKINSKKIGQISKVSWRNKFNFDTKNSKEEVINWHDSYNIHLSGEGEKIIQSSKKQGDLFYTLFLGDFCAGPQCSLCKYKYDHSSADIRIGDCWSNRFSNEEKGVSAVIAFTDRGTQVIEKLNNVSLEALPFRVVAENQMKKPIRIKLMNSIIIKYLGVNNFSLLFLKFLIFLQRILTKLKLSP